MQPSVQVAHAASSNDQQSQEPQFRLLVAEDAQCVQMKLGWLLGKMNLKVDMAKNGQMACEMAEKSRALGTPYDLILMDIHMPVMNGQDATRWLRQHGWQGPIVAVSALADNSDSGQFLDAGCNGYIAKPVTEASLRDVLARHLQR